MRITQVKLGRRSYAIAVGNKIIRSLDKKLNRLNLGNSAFIITNPLVRNKCSGELIKVLKKAGLNFKIKVVPDTEKSKSIAVLSSVIRDLARFDLKKRTFIIALGGGVVGDLSGLVASIYKRGIPYIQIPTTLLAQVDSAIGGKTALDLSEGKNLIGAFYQPRLVFSDVALLKSLEARQLRTGLAEVIKYGIIKDKRLFAYLEKNCKDILRSKTEKLAYIVNASSKIKAGIVGCDEREEKGLRTVLNFGHTLGHAIECACGFNKYNHGEAVALGMLIALEISKRMGLIKGSLQRRIEGLIKRTGLPHEIKGIALKNIIKAYHRDKKFIGRKNRLVLIADLGKAKVVENVPFGIIEEAVKSLYSA
ncbi:MAG: 3-dehydroquinate synthase [Candidatus Omnitrophica bacterium]|nr:3-dehydroquinate synthase [Candidatus Omnitrophota bacterium]MDD5661948.1 3-dehydroquinate synthase [Candidatus Omnitrophota bacterium]